MRKKLKEYDILRALLVVLVVFGHSFYNVLSYGAMNLNYGYTAYHSFWNVLWNIHHIVYSFHMQAFFALSGAVFYLSGGSNHTMDQVIGKKAKKLLVPFFACAYFYMLPVKLIGGGYQYSCIGQAVDGIFYASGDAGHLWFLPTLFINFIVLEMLICLSKMLKSRFLPAVITVALYVYFKNDNLDIPYISFYYLGWFVFGYYFEQIRRKTDLKIHKMWIVLSLAAWYPMYRLLPDNSEILTLLGMWNIYMISMCITRYTKRQKVCDWICRHSFAIYLYHEPISILILRFLDVFDLYFLYESWYGILIIVLLRMAVPVAASVLLEKIAAGIYARGMTAAGIKRKKVSWNEN